ncbi:beta strand repeat-containing protein [Microbulbifer pacificus]|uniref:beta strand repeat-containing protein n=1 Tax=Microbulbifer pacificus TaxID=407164 RepID=UPI001319EAB1|nr:filamentous hemagglutinin N-terminal domain-containing protein [Microbulbifer pacificus]
MKKSTLSVAVKAAQLAFAGLFTVHSAVASPGTYDPETVIGEVAFDGDSTFEIGVGFAKIDWDTFNIGQDEYVTFQFGSDYSVSQASSVIVNRVVQSGGVSRILGDINSNGHVVLINPNGILFGENASINVEALTLSALDGGITGVGEGFEFSVLDGAAGDIGVIDAVGEINAPRGVTFIGKSVKNHASINSGIDSSLVVGNVNFYSADKAVLSLDANGLIGVQIDQNDFIEEFNSDYASHAIENAGTIVAANVVMEARVADGFAQAAINNTGTVTAKGISTDGGTIRLSASSYNGESVAAINLGAGSSLIAEVAPDTSGGAGTVTLSAADDVINAGSISADRADSISGGAVSVSAAKGFLNTGDVQAGSFSLAVGSSVTDTDSSSVLGDITSTDTMEVTNNGGIAVVDASAQTSRSTATRIDDEIVVYARGADEDADPLASFQNVSRLELGDDSVLEGTDGEDRFTLTTDGVSYLATEIVGVGRIDGLNGEDTLVGRAQANWELSRNKAAGKLSSDEFDGIALASLEVLEANNAGVVALSANENIVLIDENTVTVDGWNYRFSGLTHVTGGGGTDSLDASALVDTYVFLKDAAGNSQIGDTGMLLNGFSSIAASEIDATALKDIAQADLDISAANTLSLADGAFVLSGVNRVRGDVGNRISGSGGWRLENDGVSNRGVMFEGEWHVDALNSALTGSAAVETYTLQSDGSLAVNSLTFENFSSVAAGGGDTLLASAFAGPVTLRGVDNSVSVNSVVYTGLGNITAHTLNAAAAGSSFAVSGAGISSDLISFSGLSTVFGGAGTDTVSGGSAWALGWDAGEAKAYAQLDDGIRFFTIDQFNTTSGVLTGGIGNSEFTLNGGAVAGDEAVSIYGMTFNNLESVAAGAGGKLDASSYAKAISLNGSAGEASADSLDFSGLAEITASTINGADDVAEVFAIQADGVLEETSGLRLKGVSSIAAGNSTDTSILDIVREREGEDLSVQTTATANLSGINFTEVEILEANNAGLQGTSAGEAYTLMAVGSVRVSTSTYQYANLSHITGGGGTDSLDASALVDTYVFLKDAAGNSQIGDTGMLLNGFSSIAASQIDATALKDIAQANLDISAANTLSLADGAFVLSGVSRVRGDLGNRISGSGGWRLENDGVSNRGVLFEGDWHVDALNSALTGSAAVETYTLQSDGSLAVNSLTFENFSSVAAGGGDTLLASAFAGPVSLLGANNSVSVNSVVYTGLGNVTAHTLNAAAAGSSFAVSGAGISSDLISFSGLSTVIGGAGTDTVSGGSAWALGWDAGEAKAYAQLDDGIRFFTIDQFNTTSGVLTGGIGNSEFTLNGGAVAGDEAVSIYGMTFNNLESVAAGAGGKLDASSYAKAISLNGSAGEASADSLDFSGLSEITASRIRGSSLGEEFTVFADRTISTLSMILHEVSEVFAIEGSDSRVVGADGANWILVDVDTATNNDIKFHQFGDLTATSAGLVGTAGKDEFELLDVDGSGAVVRYGDIIFEGLTGVEGGNLIGTESDDLDATAYSGSLKLTGIDNQLSIADTVVFSGIRTASFANLVGSVNNEVFLLDAAGNVDIANITMSGLVNVAGGGGTDTLDAESAVSLLEPGHFSFNGGQILFSGFADASGDTLFTGNGDDDVEFDAEGNIVVNGNTVGKFVAVDTQAGSNTITGFGNLDWFIGSDGSAVNNGVIFWGDATLFTAGGALHGTDIADSFVLYGDGGVGIGAFTAYGMSQVIGGLGDDSLDALAYANGLMLADSEEALYADGLIFSDFASASARVLTGTGNADQFEMSGDGVITELSNKVRISGVTTLNGGGGVDSLASLFAGNWALVAGASGVVHSGVNISGIANLSGGNGELRGHDGGHQFTVTGTNSIGVGGFEFDGITAVAGGAGLDGVTLAGPVTLAGVDGAFTGGNIRFTGVDSAFASSLIGTSASEQYVITGDGALSVYGVAFSGLSSVSAGAGSEDTVISREGRGYVLAADNRVEHEGIQFSEVENFVGQGASLVANGQSLATITGSGSVATGGADFSGISFLALQGAATHLQALNSVSLNDSGTIVTGGIQVSGVSSVSNTGALTGSAADEEFEISGENALSVTGMTFTDVASVAGGSGADRVRGLSGEEWQLGRVSGSVAQAGIAFTAVEQALGGSGVLQGADVDTQFELAADGSVQAGGINFDTVNTVNAGTGIDRVVTSTGARWVLGSADGSADVGGVSFAGIDQVSTQSAILDASANGVAERFALAADAAEISVLGLQFDSVAEVFAGTGGGEVASATDSWQLASGGRLLANGVTFSGINRVTAQNAQLAGTADSEQFVLGGTPGELSVAGVTFSGIADVSGNGGSDSLLGTAADDEFVLVGSGSIAAAGIDFVGIASVNAGGGADSVSGNAQQWTSVTQGEALVDGAALAAMDSVTVLFENIEQVRNTGVYSGPVLASDYFLSSPTSMNVGGVNFSGLQSIVAGSDGDTLHGVDAELSWTLGRTSGTLTDGQSSLLFSGFKQIVAGGGADTFNLNGGALTAIDTGAGNDIVYMSGTLIDTLLLGDGDDQVQILASSQPALLSAGAGNDQLMMQLAGQQWRISGNGAAQNTVGEFAFTGFEQLHDTAGGLNLVANQQLGFTASGDSAGVDFGAAGMALAYNADGDLVLLSSTSATIGGSLRALGADLTLAGDLDIESEIQSLSLRSSAGDINVAVLEKDDLEIGQINVGRGNVSLASTSFGLLTAANFRDTHITAGNIVLGYEPRVWGNVGEVINPLRMDATGTVNLVALSYFEPAFLGQQPEFIASGSKNASIASAQTSQGLKSVIQSPVDDIAQLDPGIFSEVTPYSLGIDVLNLPEVRLHGGELVPMDESEDERRRKQPMAVGGN